MLDSDTDSENIGIDERRQAIQPTNDKDKIITFLSINQKMRTLSTLKLIQYIFYKYIPYFKNLKGKLTDNAMIGFINCLHLERFPPYTVVFNQGETGRKMYFVFEGEAAILIRTGQFDQIQNNNPRRKIIRSFDDLVQQKFYNFRIAAVKRQYDHFGEIAIEQRIPRTATVITKTQTIFGVVTYEAYQQLLIDLSKIGIQEQIPFIQRLYPFSELDELSLFQIAHNFEEIILKTNQILYKRQQIVESLYLIVSGEIQIQKWEYDEYGKLISSNLGLYACGQLIGDYELLLNRVYSMKLVRVTQAIAKNTTKMLKIGIPPFLDMMKHSITLQIFDDYLDKKYKNKIDNNAFHLKRSFTQAHLKQRNDSEELKMLYIGKFKTTMAKLIKMEQQMKQVPKSTQEPIIKGKLKNHLDPHDKGSLKYLLNSQLVHPNAMKKNQIRQFDIKNFVDSLKTRVRLFRFASKLEDSNFIQTSNKFLMTEPICRANHSMRQKIYTLYTDREKY